MVALDPNIQSCCWIRRDLQSFPASCHLILALPSVVGLGFGVSGLGFGGWEVGFPGSGDVGFLAEALEFGVWG